MNKLQKIIAWLLIPKGYYCDGCPFWFTDSGKPEQENGYCSYLGKGDWDLNAERADERDLPPISLLWDGVKECSKR